MKQARKQREIDRLVAEHKALSGRIGIIELTLGGRPN